MNTKVRIGIGLLAVALVVTAALVWRQPLKDWAFRKEKPTEKSTAARELASIEVIDKLPTNLISLFSRTHSDILRSMRSFFRSTQTGVSATEFVSSGTVKQPERGFSFNLNVNLNTRISLGDVGRGMGEFLGFVDPEKLSDLRGDQQLYHMTELLGSSDLSGFFSMLRVENNELRWLIVQYVYDKKKLRNRQDACVEAFIGMDLDSGEDDDTDDNCDFDDEYKQGIQRDLNDIQVLLSERDWDEIDKQVTFVGAWMFQSRGFTMGIDGFLTGGFEGYLAPQGRPTGYFFVNQLPPPLNMLINPNVILKASFHPHDGYVGTLKLYQVPTAIQQQQQLRERGLETARGPELQWVFTGVNVQNTFGQEASPVCKVAFGDEEGGKVAVSDAVDYYSKTYTYVQLAGFNVCLKTTAFSAWYESFLNNVVSVSQPEGGARAAHQVDVEALAEMFTESITPDDVTPAGRLNLVIPAQRLRVLRPSPTQDRDAAPRQFETVPAGTSSESTQSTEPTVTQAPVTQLDKVIVQQAQKCSNQSSNQDACCGELLKLIDQYSNSTDEQVRNDWTEGSTLARKISPNCFKK